MRKKSTFYVFEWATIVTFKEEKCSERQTSVKLGCGKQVAHTAVSCFTKFRTYGNRREKGVRGKRRRVMIP